MGKHAYLIIAHKMDNTLFTLLRMIDDDRNDIFIHMDSKCQNFSEAIMKKNVYSSNIYYTDRTNVQWGGYSQINCELLLLKYATELHNYKYYHLLSGEDLPIKTQDYIHRFFEQNDGFEFVRIEKEKFTYYNRIRYYYPFQEKYGRNIKLGVRGFTLLQKFIGIRRNKGILFQKGSNWFSITDQFARYVIEQEKYIQHVFRSTVCCDEVFLQTVLINSPFRNKLYHSKYDDAMEMSMRYIDWGRGKPYVWREKDFDELNNSEMIFARKFSTDIDNEIIKRIEKQYS